MGIQIIEAAHRIKRTPNGNTFMMRYSFNGSTYRAYGRSATDCTANCTMQCIAVQDELDRRAAHSTAVKAWQEAND